MKIYTPPIEYWGILNRFDVLQKALEEWYDVFDCDIIFNNQVPAIDLSQLEKYSYTVNWRFIIFRAWLKSLKWSPKEVWWDFQVVGNELISLEWWPTEVGWVYWCSQNKLKNLVGVPKLIKWNFLCDNNELETLEGWPEEVWWNIWLKNNKLTSLIWLSKSFWDYVSLTGNNLTPLKILKKNFFELWGFVFKWSLIPKLKILMDVKLDDVPNHSTFIDNNSTKYAKAFNEFIEKVSLLGKLEDIDDKFLKINWKTFNKKLLKL